MECKTCTTADPVGGLNNSDMCQVCAGSVLGNILSMPKSYHGSDYSQTLGLCQALNIIRKDIQATRDVAEKALDAAQRAVEGSRRAGNWGPAM